MVREERRRRGWSLDELADRAGLSRAAVYNIESGKAGSVSTYARLAAALNLEPDFDLADPRRTRGARRDEDPVHAAVGEIEAGHLARLGYKVALDEPYQHYQFAGRADLVAWQPDLRALLHIENKGRLPNIGEVTGSFTTKRNYLGPILAERFGIPGGWRSETHVLVALWSAEVLHALRLRGETFRATCPDPADGFVAWWSGNPPTAGRSSTLVVLDPVEVGQSSRRRMIGLDEVRAAKPRYRDYAAALDVFKRNGMA